jgi:hypothetical protein
MNKVQNPNNPKNKNFVYYDWELIGWLLHGICHDGPVNSEQMFGQISRLAG